MKGGKKKMNKKILLFIVLPIVVAGLVAAGLLTYYGQIHQYVPVEQAVLVDGGVWTDEISSELGTMHSLQNLVFVSAHRLENVVNIDAEISLIGSCSAEDFSGGCSDIDTNYYKTNLRQGTLILSEKDANWVVKDGMKATLNYELVDGKFKYNLSATGLESGIEYVLIYYADQPDRFVVWGGAPALKLGEATSDDTGSLEITDGSQNIPGSLLPYANDWNAGTEADYCSSTDAYTHCRGAKIWLIPLDAYNGNEVVVKWEPTRFLFETNLLGWNHNNELPNPVDVSANSYVDFVIVSDFPELMKPDIYTITTSVEPVEPTA